MSESTHQYGRRSGNGLWLLVATAAVVVLLVFLMRDDGPQTGQGGDREMLVYCAAGVKKAVEEIAGKFEQEVGVSVALEYASSGVLANKLKTDRESGIDRADVYIPADYLYTERAAADGLTAESMKVASWKVVLAMKPDSPTSAGRRRRGVAEKTLNRPVRPVGRGGAQNEKDARAVRPLGSDRRGQGGHLPDRH